MGQTELDKEKPSVDLQKLRTVMRQVKSEDMEPLIDAFLGMLEAFGKMMIGVGNLQKNSPDAYEYAREIGENPQAFLSIMIEKMPSARLKKGVQAFLELLSIMPKMRMFDDLPADEKIQLGEQVIDIVKRLRLSEEPEESSTEEG